MSNTDTSTVPSNGATMHDEPSGAISLVQVANAVLRHRYLVVAVPVAAVVLSIASMALSGKLTRRTYTATSAFAPAGRATPSGTGLAAQLALGTSGGDPAQSPAFYVELIRTKPLLREVVMTEFPVSAGAEAQTLAEILLEKPNPPPAGIESAIGRLSGATSVAHNPRTNVVTLSVSMPTPALAHAVNSRYLEMINKFNLERRQTQAASERRFAEQRLEEVRAELREAEDRLQAFLERNREFRLDPSLSFAHDRLSRNVALRQQIVATLTQAYETARVDQARDTPVITVVAQPEPPVFPDPRGRVRSVVLAAMLGLAVGVRLALWRDYSRYARARKAEEYQAFDDLRSEVLTDFRQLLSRRRAARTPTAPTEHR